MRFAVLGSGSKGNAVLVEAGGTCVLIDCGLQPKQLRARLREVDRELTDVHALLITHAHSDHCVGAMRLASTFRWRTFATKQTNDRLGRRGGLLNFAAVEPGTPFLLDALTVTATRLPHDMPGTVTFAVEHGGKKLAVCTDAGHATPEMTAALSGCDTLMLEFNHDVDMLQRGPYPARLKRRVGSDVGHLSNEQAAQLLFATERSRLLRVVLAHLSEVNNTPRLAIAAAREAAGEGVEVIVAPQYCATPWYDVGVSDGVAEHVLEDVMNPGRPAPPSFGAARQRIIQSLRTTPLRAAPRVAVPSIALKRQLSLFSDEP